MEYITKTIEAHDRHISNDVDRRGLLRYHTEVLRNCRSAHRPGRIRECDEAIRQHLSRIIVHYNGQTPDTAVEEERRLLGWEERLSGDPLVQLETLQAELMAYSTQLLLCLGALLFHDRSYRRTWFTSEEVDISVDSVAKLQARCVTNVDVVHALKVTDFVVLNQHYPMNNLTQRFDSLCPILTRAFRSTSDDVLDAAHNALAAFGSMAWELSDRPKTNPEFFLKPEFYSAALRSLGRPAIKGSQCNDQALSCWLAASVRSDTTLAGTLDAPSITALFVSRVLEVLDEGSTAGDTWTM
ncbi:hypothetical protein FRB95_002097 [Tulasnella sp. JGI-2019a]|nr:hypothetical protein FRB95_002097 [Tulasnella sp. JGI-2019a]